jgi:hypothetical protein
MTCATAWDVGLAAGSHEALTRIGERVRFDG